VLRAFPGAEGSGALSVGGRGGTVYEVTNLNDSGPGSFRAACEASPRRVVVFRVGGTIVLQSRIRITSPYLTIAGQTAPGDGIQITAKTPGGADTGVTEPLLQIGAHNVIIRYIRIRPGNTGASGVGDTTGIRISTGYGHPIYNVIIDHVSINWWGGNAVTVWDGVYSTNTPRRLRDISVQNCCFAENIYTMRFGVNIGSAPAEITSENSYYGADMGDIDMHRNLLSTTFVRFPLIGRFSGNARCINNIFYNTYGGHTGVRSATPPRHAFFLDLIGNKYDTGPLQPKSSSRNFYPITVEQNTTYPPKVFLEGNWSDLWGYDNYNMMTMSSSATASQTPNTPASDIYRKSTRTNAPAIPVTEFDVDNIDAEILSHIGASKKLNNDGYLIDNRDSVDTRVIEQGYLNRTALSFLEHESEVGGFPVLATGTPYPHSGDGISDAWKTRNGVTGNIGADLVPGLVGWTYLDLFLAGLDIPGGE
jgi:pectate lyase